MERWGRVFLVAGLAVALFGVTRDIGLYDAAGLLGRIEPVLALLFAFALMTAGAILCAAAGLRDIFAVAARTVSGSGSRTAPGGRQRWIHRSRAWRS